MRRCLACLFLVIILTACQQAPESTPVYGTPVPYQTAPPTQTPSLIPGLTEIVLPTATTTTYTVAQGDTLISIAAHSGVSLQALQAANPGISPTSLSVGAKLIIPGGEQVTGEPSPTPAALAIPQARCWPETTGGLWCFALARNDYAETLENLSAQFVLTDSSGRELTSQIAYGLLDILPPGAAMPLAAHFAGPLPVDADLRAQVLTAIRLLPGDTRYLPAMLVNTLLSVDGSGSTAEVSGKVVLSGAGKANTVWVLASAYDAAGDVVGVRRWESGSALSANAPVSFDFLLSSVGPAIARAEFLVEARP